MIDKENTKLATGESSHSSTELWCVYIPVVDKYFAMASKKIAQLRCDEYNNDIKEMYKNRPPMTCTINEMMGSVKEWPYDKEDHAYDLNIKKWENYE